MKKSYLFLFLFIVFFVKGYSQDCISLGCAANHTGITTDGSLPDIAPPNGLGCYAPYAYKQVYWQFFYSPSGGIFSQTYTPTSIGDPLSLNFIVYDMGTSAPSSVSCPADTSSWTAILCAITDYPNQPVGPSVAGHAGDTLNTVGGHYYAIAIIIWQGTSTGGNANYTFDISTPQLGGVDLTAANCPGVLPVKLSSFDASVNNCVVNLNWTAENESNFKNYEVQSGTDGTNFNTIATIDAATQGTDQKYSFNDLSTKVGNSYYRLKMNDIDGKFEFSKIINIKLNCNQNSFDVYPNPVTDVLNINIGNLQNNGTIAKLFDTNGKLIYSGKMRSGTNTIDMSQFAKGVYLLKLKNNTETQNIKIIK